MIAGALIASAAGAQDFPTRPIKLVIAFPAGGPTDFVGRLLADKLKDDLGQSVIIENKAGASGTLGPGRPHAVSHHGRRGRDHAQYANRHAL
jgi:tripartite-type tricarboxylate transporter receptor subunit TctC